MRHTIQNPARLIAAILICCLLAICCSTVKAQVRRPSFNVIAFYPASTEDAHMSFIHEANNWFLAMGRKYGFSYDSTSNWASMNTAFLNRYQVVLFLDARPDSLNQRLAFKNYMDSVGAWMGFHFAAFALTPSAFNQDWDWYHNTFIGAGQYVSNTWKPTSAILRVENRKHPATKGLPATITAAPNEWYRWEKDLRTNPDINILLSIDSSSFPLGTGPKLYEIWHSGYYPVVWSNKNYRMVYFNMGHNDIDYAENKATRQSSTFQSPQQNKLILNTLLWLGKAHRQGVK